MLKKVGISLMAAMMMSSVALACDFSLSYNEYLECCFSLVDNEKNIQESKKDERKMLKFDKEVVKKVLMGEGYVEYKEEIEESNSVPKFRQKIKNLDLNIEYVDPVIQRLGTYDARLQPILDAYIADRTISEDFNVEGVTMKVIMKRWRHSDFWRCLGIMNKAINDPEYARGIPKGMSL